MKSVNCRGPERERRAGRHGDTERKTDRNGQRWRAARRRGPRSDFLLSSGFGEWEQVKWHGLPRQSLSSSVAMDTVTTALSSPTPWGSHPL